MDADSKYWKHIFWGFRNGKDYLSSPKNASDMTPFLQAFWDKKIITVILS